MRTHPMARAGLRAGLVSALTWAGACKGPPHVAQPIECADECCGGNGVVDCEAHFNVDCIQDADVCTALAYGCTNGIEYSGVIPASRPPGCSSDAGIGDAVTFGVADGFSGLLVAMTDGAAPSDASESGVAPDGAPSDAGQSGAMADAGQSDAMVDGADDSPASD